MPDHAATKTKAPPPGDTRADAPTRNLGRVLDLVLGEGLLIAFLVPVGLFAFRNPLSLSSSTLINIWRQPAETGMGAAAKPVVILMAGIDLPVGSVLALPGLTTAILATQGGLLGNL